MKILYLTTWDFSNEETDGVCKKIKWQIKTFQEWGHQVDLLYIKTGSLRLLESGTEQVLSKIGTIKKIPAYLKMYRHIKSKKYNWIYNRYGMMDTFYYQVLRRLKKNGARILIELPTYPYKGELPRGLLYTLLYKWDAWYVPKIKNVADGIVTFSNDSEIFGVPAIQIMNGIDVNEIKPIERTFLPNDIIDLLMIALMQPYHGYERLLYGLNEYYQSGGKREVCCHFVGDGLERMFYENIVREKGLENHVVFYGFQSSSELERIYGMCDIGVTSLGTYKKQVFLSSELKIREYLAKGLPIVSGCNQDLFLSKKEKFYLQFPNNNSAIDISKIIAFYDFLYKEKGVAVAKEVREFAEKQINIGKVMEPINEFMKRAKP